MLLQEAFTCIREKFAAATVPLFVSAALNHVLERGPKDRRAVGQLIDKLVRANMITRQQCTTGGWSWSQNRLKNIYLYL